MKIMMFYGGGDTGGGKTHILSLAKELSKNVDLRIVSFRDGGFAAEAKAMGLDTVVVDHRRGFLYAAKEAVRCVDEYGPDLVHSHGSKANLLGVMIKKKRGIPAVTTVHSDPKLDYIGKPLRRYTFGLANEMALREMDYYVAVAGRMKELLIERNFDPFRIFTVFNGMDFEGSPDAPRKAENEKDVINLGIAARLDPVKDIDTLIRAFAMAYEKDSRLRLKIAGTGDCEASLKNLAKTLGVESAVSFEGWISDIKGFFRDIDINVLTSISETFPYSLLEGAYEHCPAIASNAGGIPYLIEHEKTGLMFECGDAKTLSEYILRLAGDPQLRVRLAENLRSKAMNQFSLARMAADQEEIYRTVIRRSRRQEKRDGVVLCGAYGMGNAGDEAILKSICEELRSVDPDMPVYVMSRDPKGTRLKLFTRSFYTFNPFLFISSARKSKLLISGGGSLIQDVTSSRSLYFYLLVIRCAKMLGCRVAMYGCGVGPLLKDSHRKLAAKVINKNVDLVTLRDSMSLELMHSMGANQPKICLSADPTFSLPRASDEEIDRAFESEGIPSDTDMLALSLRTWPDFKEPDKLARLAEYAFKTYGLRPVFIPIECPKDIEMGEKVASLIDSSVTTYVCRKAHYDRELIGMLSRMKVICGMRLHSLIFAACAGTPSIGISYDVKVDGFLKDCGNSRCLPVSDIDYEVLKSYLDQCMKDGRTVSEQVSAQFAEAEKTNVNSIAELLKL